MLQFGILFFVTTGIAVGVWRVWEFYVRNEDCKLLLLVDYLEDLYDRCKRKDGKFDEVITKCGCRDRQEAIQKIIECSTKIAKRYQMICKFAVRPKDRASLKKNIEMLERNCDKFKAIQKEV